MGEAIIFNKNGMVNGKVVGALLKIRHWIAAALHYLTHELIGL